jgi:hypothetical protein
MHRTMITDSGSRTNDKHHVHKRFNRSSSSSEGKRSVQRKPNEEVKVNKRFAGQRRRFAEDSSDSAGPANNKVNIPKKNQTLNLRNRRKLGSSSEDSSLNIKS